MTKLKIIKAPDVRLKQKAMKVEKFDETLKQFANDMLETLADEAGLASIQIEDSAYFSDNSYFKKAEEGYRQQPNVIIVNIDKTSSSKETEPLIAVNAEIIETSQEMIEEQEACLSFPNTFSAIPRHKKIKVKFWDLQGKEHINEYEGMQSICFQHEIDNQNGIQYPDRLPKLKQLLFWKQYEQKKRNIQ